MIYADPPISVDNASSVCTVLVTVVEIMQSRFFFNSGNFYDDTARSVVRGSASRSRKCRRDLIPTPATTRDRDLPGSPRRTCDSSNAVEMSLETIYHYYHHYLFFTIAKCSDIFTVTRVDENSYFCFHKQRII